MECILNAWHCWSKVWHEMFKAFSLHAEKGKLLTEIRSICQSNHFVLAKSINANCFIKGKCIQTNSDQEEQSHRHIYNYTSSNAT